MTIYWNTHIIHVLHAKYDFLSECFFFINQIIFLF